MSRGDRNAPIWTRSEPSARTPRLTRAQIAQSALAIADREGFEAVTMRRIAAELGVGTMTLYRYVRTKDDVVALMDDALMAQALVPDGELVTDDWRRALAAVARRTREVLVRHPWALTALQEAQFGPSAMRHFEQSLAAVAGTGLASAAKFELLSLVDDYVFGNVLHTHEARLRTAMAAADPDTVRALVEYGMARLREGGFPHTAALLNDAGPGEGSAPALDPETLDRQFERGLGAMLDGAARLFGIQDGSPPAT
jgi:AcrR family transcriptional regulator